MYLHGSKWNMRQHKRRNSPFRIILLVVLIGAALYINQIVVPATPPLFVPTLTPTRAPESYINEAEQAFNDGKLLQSINSYEQAILVDPNNRANYVNLARVQNFAGMYADAQKNAELALVGNDDYGLAHAVRAKALDEQGNYLEAEATIRRALEIEPNNPLFNAYYAEILIDKGDYGDLESAIASSRKAVELGPNMLETHNARGYVLLNTGNCEEAIQEFKAALAINSKISDTHLNLGLCYRSIGDYANAIQAFLDANALNPNDDIPDLEMSRTYAQIGEYGKAIQSAEQALKDAPQNPHRYGNLGIMYYKNGQYDQAVNFLALAVHGGTSADGVSVEGLPLDYGFIAQYYYTYGLALARLNRCAEALPIFQALLSAVPDDEFSVYNANEGLNICRENLGTQTPPSDTTPGVETTPGAEVMPGGDAPLQPEATATPDAGSG
jgi:tetratricopeptide (TPR) repeat protein